VERKIENKKKIRLMYKERKRKIKESKISKKEMRREDHVRVHTRGKGSGRERRM
jgi:hypothetical protein